MSRLDWHVAVGSVAISILMLGWMVRRGLVDVYRILGFSGTLARDVEGDLPARCARTHRIPPAASLHRTPGPCVFTRPADRVRLGSQYLFIDSRTVDVHIRRLRKALNGKDEQDVIRTVRSAGYVLDAEAAIA